jgi:hypothetical protein
MRALQIRGVVHNPAAQFLRRVNPPLQSSSYTVPGSLVSSTSGPSQ